MTKSDWQIIHKIYRQLRSHQTCTEFDAMCAAYQAWKLGVYSLDAARGILGSVLEFDLRFSHEAEKFAAAYRPVLMLSSQGRWIFGNTLVHVKPGSILKLKAHKDALEEFVEV